MSDRKPELDWVIDGDAQSMSALLFNTAKSIGKLRLDWRIKPRVHEKRSTMHEKAPLFFSLNWRLEK